MAGRATRIRSGTVQVAGLAEVDRALKELGPDVRAELKKTNRDVAEREAGRARARGLSLGGVAAKTAASIAAVGSFQSAGLAFGGSKYPFAGGAEFGSYRFPQFQPWRGNDSNAGYFVYPTIRDDADEIAESYDSAVKKVISRNFPD